jgi:hypothetical protein
MLVRFGNEFPFLQENLATIPSGFTANNIKILAQKVPSGTTRPSSTLWREINVYSQISATTVNNYLTQTGMTGTTIQITKNMYDTAPIYDLNNYIQLPQIGQTGLTLNFGGEYYFFGNIETDIQATWNGSTPPYITEVALYNANKELMVISKIQSPEKRQGIQQYPIKLDF